MLIVGESWGREPDASPGALTLDLALVVLDLLQRTGGAAPLNPRLVLARKGYRRWGRERQEFERKILDQIRLLQGVHIQAQGETSPLLEFSPRNVARTDFIVRAGPALSRDLQAGGWSEVPNSVLRLDHRRNRGCEVLAKKIAVVLALNGNPGLICARDLLTLAGHAPPSSAHRRDRTAERLPDALRRLRELGVLETQGLEALGRSPPSRQWLGHELWIRLRPPGEQAAQPGRRLPSPVAVRESAAPGAISQLAVARRGRPRFQPSGEQRRIVSALLASGATRERIAQTLGVSLPTLRSYFAAEFHGARSAMAAECGDVLA